MVALNYWHSLGSTSLYGKDNSGATLFFLDSHSHKDCNCLVVCLICFVFSSYLGCFTYSGYVLVLYSVKGVLHSANDYFPLIAHIYSSWFVFTLGSLCWYSELLLLGISAELVLLL